MEAPAKALESIDVAQRLVTQAVADHASGVRGVMTIDVGDMTPEEALKVVTSTKAQYRAALGKPPVDGHGFCMLCRVRAPDCKCAGACPPMNADGRCVMCNRMPHACECPADQAGTAYARCTDPECGKVYRVALTATRRCEHCGGTPVEIIDPSARTFTTKGGFLTTKEPTAADLDLDDTACSCGGVNRIGPPEPGDPEKIQHDDPNCLFHHPLTSADAPVRGLTQHAVMLDDANLFTPDLANLPPVPVADLVPMLEALKYINGGDAHADEARAEAHEVLEDFDKKHPNVLTALHDPRDDEDADDETVAIVVNGRPFNVAEKVLDYRAVVALAKFDAERTLTVTYRAKGWPSGPQWSGTLLREGGTVEVRPGMVFNVADTSKA